MSNVTLMIGGRSYTVACDEGQEAHIQDLGRAIAAKVEGMAAMSEPRQLLFAALLLADELHEARQSAAAQPKLDPSRLESLAQRLENCAASLEGEGRLL